MTAGSERQLAYPAGTDPVALARSLHEAHDSFVHSGALASALRPVVVESWLRSIGAGVDPEETVPRIDLDTPALEQARAQHPLRPAMPVVRRLLVESATEAGMLVAVSDAAGRLLWVEGSSSLRSRAESMAFVEGANWSEGSAGTNAPGTALALGRAVQIFGAEHLSRPVTPWSCSASPIHDPDTGAVLGVLDLTGGPEVAMPQSLALVRATAAAVEAELRIERLSVGRRDPATSPGSGPASLQVLGERGAQLSHAAGLTRLSPRHSEILLLLAAAPEGLWSGELVNGLTRDAQAAVTIRAEMSRFRSSIAPLTMLSKPYRLIDAVTVDALDVRAAMRRGELRRAIAGYRGPVLPESTAPSVVRLRDELHGELRAVLLARRDPDALLTFADTPHGGDDLEIWSAALGCLPFGSPRQAQVRTHVDRLVRRT